MAAGSRGKFWKYHDRLFDNFGKLSDRKFLDIAQDMGFKPQEFEKMMKDPEIMAKVRRDSQDGRRAGVRGTPTIFINGRLFKKKRTPSGFQVLIDKELKTLRKKGR